MTGEPNGFGGALGGLFGGIRGGMKRANVKAREAAEREATRTEKQRELARNRERSVQVNFRAKERTVQTLEALAVKLGVNKTAALEIAIRELAARHGVASDE